MSDIVLKGYVQLRRGLLTHLNERRITLNEFVVFNILLMLADKETGSYKTNALAIQFWTGGQLSEDGADRALRSLEKKGYIVREITPGQYGVYPYHVQKFVVTHGAEVGKVLTFKKNSKGVEKTEELLAAFGAESADEGAVGTAEDHAEVGAVPPADKTILETGDLKPETQGRKEGREVGTSKTSSSPSSSSSDQRIEWIETLAADQQHIFNAIYPVTTPDGFDFQNAQALLERVTADNAGIPWRRFFEWTRTHQPEKLHYRSLEQFTKAMATGHALNKFHAHDGATCKVCKRLAEI